MIPPNPNTKTPLDIGDSYGQVCPVSLALDQVGSRWTLLLLRDLARTPLRFSDLSTLNPGISPTVLTGRLRSLQETGLIEKRTLRGPGRSSVYAIAETSRPTVTSVLVGLAGLGSDLLDTNPPQVDPAVAFAAQLRLNATFVLARQSTIEGYYLFDLTAWQNHIIIENNAMTIPDDPPDRAPDAIAAFTPPTTLMRITGGAQAVEDAEHAGQLEISGDHQAMIELLRLLSIETPR